MEKRTIERAIYGEVCVEADLKEVWDAWTTEKGITSFFAPACNVDLQPDGPYEIFFNPDSPPGERGGEGLRIMSMGKTQGTPLLAAGGMDRRDQHMAASNCGWLFPWNLPWTNRGDKLAK